MPTDDREAEARNVAEEMRSRWWDASGKESDLRRALSEAQQRVEALEKALRECLIESPHSYRGKDAPTCLCRWCKARVLVGVVPMEPHEDKRPKTVLFSEPKP